MVSRAFQTSTNMALKKNSNQIRIIDKDRGITLQILYGEICSLEVKDDPKKTNDEKYFWIDNPEFIRAIWRVFKKAEEHGFLKEALRNTDEDDEQFIEIEV